MALNVRARPGGKAGATPRQPRRGVSRPSLVLNLVSAVAGIGLWWLLAGSGKTLPSPPQVLSKAISMLGDGTLEGDTEASVLRVLAGFALGCALAVPVGFLMGWYRVARGLIEPWVQFFRSIPPLAIIPLAIVELGIGETAKVVVIFLAAFLACVIPTFQGVVTVDRTLINAARVLGAGDRVIFTRVAIPAATPYIFVGMRIALGSSWATLIASELIAAQQGLGFRMQSAELYFDLQTIFVDLVTIGILGLLMDRILLLVERRFTDWQERR